LYDRGHTHSLFDGEICVGGVYLRLYMKEPTFPLHDAKEFLEALVPEICAQVGHIVNDTDGGGTPKRAADIATLTSGLVSLLKVRPCRGVSLAAALL
jgi:hypothetical protein